MSVQNPERVVTKQDLADFYQGILPYLGGMPDILANKFSKGDMYSTDEKIIGQWIDGKPLYQKTIPSTVPAVSGDTEISLSSFGIDTMVDISSSAETLDVTPLVGYVGTGGQGSISIDVFYAASSNKLFIRNISNAPAENKSLNITIKYTKTADSVVSIGNDTDYSTTEKIVGTWINGKPIWQKTINFGTLPDTSDKEVSHNIQNIDAITNIYCILINPTTGYSLVAGYCGVNMNHTSDTGLGADRSMVKIKTYDDRSAYTGYVTLQYTKTN